MFCFLERSFNFCLEMKTVFVSGSIVQLQLAMIDMKYVNLALLTVNCNCYVWYINNVYVPFFNVNLNVVIGDNVHTIYHITEVNKMIT